MKQKVVVGLSGGVDSSVAAFLLKEQGYEVIGVTMLLWSPEQERAQAEPQSVVDARKVAEHLGIEYHVLDFKAQFKKEVVDYFTSEYLAGRTPNPCNVCNRRIKWEALLAWANEQGAEYIATGHYARIDQLENGRYAIRNSVTAQKDQTYALYNLTQEQLCKTLLPVGEFSKEEIAHWLKVFLRRFFSQQFKRSALPDGPKVGSVSLSPRGDWRMSSDSSMAVWMQEFEAL